MSLHLETDFWEGRKTQDLLHCSRDLHSSFKTCHLTAWGPVGAEGGSSRVIVGLHGACFSDLFKSSKGCKFTPPGFRLNVPAPTEDECASHRP